MSQNLLLTELKNIKVVQIPLEAIWEDNLSSVAVQMTKEVEMPETALPLLKGPYARFNPLGRKEFEAFLSHFPPEKIKDFCITQGETSERALMRQKQFYADVVTLTQQMPLLTETIRRQNDVVQAFLEGQRQRIRD